MSFRALDGVMCFSFSLALMCFVCVSIMNYEDFSEESNHQKSRIKERIKPDNENNENNDESREE